MNRAIPNAPSKLLLCLCVALLLWAGRTEPATAGEITLDIKATTKVVDHNVEAVYTLKNYGSDTASNVSVDVTLLGQSRKVDVAPSIGPQESRSATMTFSLPANAKGTFPLFSQAHYRDPSEAPFSIAALGVARTGESPASAVTLTASTLKKWGNIRVDVTSTDLAIKKVKLTCHPPADLAARPPQADVKLTDGKGSYTFNIKNNTGTPGSTYVLFYVAEYDLGGVHFLTTTQSKLPIEQAAGGGLHRDRWQMGLNVALVLAALGVVAAFFRRSREAMRLAFESGRWPVLALELVALAAIEFFIVANVSPQYLLTDTITTGGDTGSHYYTVQYMQNELLPHGKVSDWTPGNYAGFPILQFYFPLPFLLMCLLNVAIPLTVAFKLISLLGTFLLPVTAWAMLRLMRVPFPGPALGAAFTLPFLFNCGNSMWGGNIPSTLAGELSYSLSMALSLLLLGSLYRGCQENRRVILNAFLVFLVGFSHGYTLLFCEAMSLFFLITPNNFVQRVVYLGKVYGLGFCLLAFWLVPLLAYSYCTTPYHTVWTINEVKEVLPEVLRPFLVAAGAGVVGLLGWGIAVSLRRSAPALLGLAFFGFALAMAGVMFVAAPKIGVVDIRYVPYAQLFACLIAAMAIGWAGLAFHRVGLSWALLLVVLAGTFVWTLPYVSYVPSWCKWNYEGFEAKPSWRLFQRINGHLRGTFQDPRVVYEHSNDHNRFGTSRAFESLPLFAGRATLEGLYMQASLSAPFVFYIQSEVSKEKSCPFPQYTYATMDYARARRHLELFNVRDLLVVSPQAKAALRENKDYELVTGTGLEEYELWRLKTNPNRYVEPLKYAPVLYTDKDWKPVAHQWFTTDNLLDVHLIFDSHLTSNDLVRFKTVEHLQSLPHTPIDTSGCEISEKITNNEVIIHTNWLNKPLLVKMSYHPNWHVEGADKVYLASPSFMVIYPNREHVRLYYGPGWPDKLGRVFGLIGIFILLLNIPLPAGRRTGWAMIAQRLGIPESLEPRIPFNPSSRTRWILLATVALTAATAILTVSYLVYTREPHRLFNDSVKLKDAACAQFKIYKGEGDRHKKVAPPSEPVRKKARATAHEEFEQARLGFRRVMVAQPTSALGQESAYYIGITYYLEEDDDGAIAAFRDLLKRYPNSHWAPEALYHIGFCQFRSAQKLSGEEAADREQAGIQTMQEVLARFPNDPWAEHARDRMREHGAKNLLLPKGLPADVGQRMGSAIALFNQDRIDECLPIFEEIAMDHRDYSAAPQALACFALCHFKKLRWSETIDAYQLLVDRYPTNDLVPEALYHIALCTQKLNRDDEAIPKYRQLIEKYPNSPFAKYAKDRLKDLRIQDN